MAIQPNLNGLAHDNTPLATLLHYGREYQAPTTIVLLGIVADLTLVAVSWTLFPIALYLMSCHHWHYPKWTVLRHILRTAQTAFLRQQNIRRNVLADGAWEKYDNRPADGKAQAELQVLQRAHENAHNRQHLDEVVLKENYNVVPAPNPAVAPKIYENPPVEPEPQPVNPVLPEPNVETPPVAPAPGPQPSKPHPPVEPEPQPVNPVLPEPNVETPLVAPAPGPQPSKPHPPVEPEPQPVNPVLPEPNVDTPPVAPAPGPLMPIANPTKAPKPAPTPVELLIKVATQYAIDAQASTYYSELKMKKIWKHALEDSDSNKAPLYAIMLKYSRHYSFQMWPIYGDTSCMNQVYLKRNEKNKALTSPGGYLTMPSYQADESISHKAYAFESKIQTRLPKLLLPNLYAGLQYFDYKITETIRNISLQWDGSIFAQIIHKAEAKNGGSQSTVIPIRVKTNLYPSAQYYLSYHYPPVQPAMTQSYSNVPTYRYYIKILTLDIKTMLGNRSTTFSLTNIDSLQGVVGDVKTLPNEDRQAGLDRLFPQPGKDARPYDSANVAQLFQNNPVYRRAFQNLYAADVISRNLVSQDIAQRIMQKGNQRWIPYVRSAPLWLRADQNLGGIRVLAGRHLLMEEAEGRPFCSYMYDSDSRISSFQKDVAPLALTDMGELIRQVTWLQVCDFIVGQVDHSYGNVFFCPQNLHRQTWSDGSLRPAICGIDNDGCLAAFDDPSTGLLSRYTNTPPITRRCGCDQTTVNLPVIDRDMYNAIMGMTVTDIEQSMKQFGRDPEDSTCYKLEYEAAALRLLNLQLIAKDLMSQGRILAPSDWKNPMSVINIIHNFTACDTLFRSLFDPFLSPDPIQARQNFGHWQNYRCSRLFCHIEYGYNRLNNVQKANIRTIGDLLRIPVDIPLAGSQGAIRAPQSVQQPQYQQQYQQPIQPQPVLAPQYQQQPAPQPYQQPIQQQPVLQPQCPQQPQYRQQQYQQQPIGINQQQAHPVPPPPVYGRPR